MGKVIHIYDRKPVTAPNDDDDEGDSWLPEPLPVEAVEARLLEAGEYDLAYMADQLERFMKKAALGSHEGAAVLAASVRDLIQARRWNIICEEMLEVK